MLGEWTIRLITASGILCVLLRSTISAATFESPLPSKPPESKIVTVRTGDPAIIAAVKRARAGLAEFLALAERPPDGTREFGVKIGIPYNETDAEFVWLQPFKRHGNGFVGRLNNTPRSVKIVKLHDLVAFDEDSIIDWYYFRDAVMIGNYTTCALLPRMHRQDRERLLKQTGLHCE